MYTLNDLRVSACFAHTVPLPPPAPFPTPRLLGSRSPAFPRYYEADKTTGLVLRHSVCHVAPQYLGLISRFRSPSRGNRLASARVLFNRSHPLFPVFRPKDTFGSPKFPANPSDLCRALGLRSVPRARSLAALGCCPRKLLPQGHQTNYDFRSSITRPQSWLFTLRAVLSNDYAKLASGGGSALPGGYLHPTEFVWRVSHLHALPSPRASLGAKQFSLWLTGRAYRTKMRSENSLFSGSKTVT